MPLYGGIDLHANNSVVVLLNEQDEVIYQKRLPNDLLMSAFSRSEPFRNYRPVEMSGGPCTESHRICAIIRLEHC